MQHKKTPKYGNSRPCSRSWMNSLLHGFASVFRETPLTTVGPSSGPWRRRKSNAARAYYHHSTCTTHSENDLEYEARKNARFFPLLKSPLLSLFFVFPTKLITLGGAADHFFALVNQISQYSRKTAELRSVYKWLEPRGRKFPSFLVSKTKFPFHSPPWEIKCFSEQSNFTSRHVIVYTWVIR